MFSSYTCYGGLGINNCVKYASSAFQSSQEDSVLLIDTIINHGRVYLVDHLVHVDAVHIHVTRDHQDQSRLLLSSLLSGLPSLTTRAVQRAFAFCTSGWLNVLLLAHHHFDLSAQQFCDALCLRYHCMPTVFDACMLCIMGVEEILV